MWELNHKECWVLKNWCFWTVVLEKTLESPLDCKEMQPVHPKGNQSWIFIGRSNAEAEAPILCLLMWRTDSLEKTLMLGKIEGRRRRGRQRMRLLAAITDSTRMNLSKLLELVMDREACHAAVHGLQRVRHDWVTELNWTELNWCMYLYGGGGGVRWAHVIMEAKKSQDLQKANSRLKKERWCNSSPSPKTNLKVHRLGSKEVPVFQLDSECRKTWY